MGFSGRTTTGVVVVPIHSNEGLLGSKAVNRHNTCVFFTWSKRRAYLEWLRRSGSDREDLRMMNEMLDSLAVRLARFSH